MRIWTTKLLRKDKNIVKQMLNDDKKRINTYPAAFRYDKKTGAIYIISDERKKRTIYGSPVFIEDVVEPVEKSESNNSPLKKTFQYV